MVIVTATIPQYANGVFFLQSAGSNLSEVAGNINTFGVFTAVILPNVSYGVTIIPPNGTSYSRFGTTFTSINEATQDITAILVAAIPPPVSIGIDLQTNGAGNPIQNILNLIDGTNVTLTPDDDGGVTVNSSGGGGAGTVTHDTTALTAGSMVVGNGAGDVKIAPVDYNVSAANALTTNSNMIINAPGPGNAGLSIANNSAQGCVFSVIATVGTGNQWVTEVTGSTTLPAFRGLLVQDATAGAFAYFLDSLDSTHSRFMLMQMGVLGFLSTTNPIAGTLDTAISRVSAGLIAIGNGTQGNASGGLSSAFIVGPATAPSGSGTTGQWALSQDGKLSFCKDGTWQVVAQAT